MKYGFGIYNRCSYIDFIRDHQTFQCKNFFKDKLPVRKQKSYGGVWCETDDKLLPKKLLISPANFSCVLLRLHLWWAIICDSSLSPDYPTDYQSRLYRSLSPRWVRRCSKALVETRLIHPLYFKIKVTCQVKVRPNPKCSFFTFWAFGSVRRAVKISNSPKALAYV